MIDSTNKQSPQEAFIIRRCLALMIDAFLFYEITHYIYPYDEHIPYFNYYCLGEITIIFLYLTILTISPLQGTIGKRLLNIKIASIIDEKIKLNQILLRSLIQDISIIILICSLYITLSLFRLFFHRPNILEVGLITYFQVTLIYLPTLFFKKNSTIHDMISKTHVVINKDSNKFITIMLWIFLAIYIYLFII